mmetsp:Transcript_17782/g.23450  ORF Transcript_17782/g.23450 Transcript_17782/m.23450 type:complete len:391 (-) Transcript_17782:624-1796(-)|eukprot:CAMPEP_0117756234 /NCGR_PEP_ID=MMETSP0947-20121206/13947_1 /TAXON_ID=44440 /ORGANISM="Chattonella subsalsa, Strain CCMP2191" /LENGTH=390 /DNA_ID=CAMNT_0005575763 /DNA_START=884 /DNA_END=2056 /DNA_ORIENTATION=-
MFQKLLLITLVLFVGAEARRNSPLFLDNIRIRGGSSEPPTAPGSDVLNAPNLAGKVSGGAEVAVSPPGSETPVAPLEASEAEAPISATAMETHAVVEGVPEEHAMEKGSREYKVAVIKTVLVVLAAGVFGAGTWVVKGRQSSLEFFAGYLVEQSLSVDNLFVFIMLFDYFQVPLQFQSRVLTWGIIGAMSMRLVMIVLGVAAIQKFRSIILLFAGILIVSGWKMIQEGEEEEDLENNAIMKISNKMVKSTSKYDGEKFFTEIDGTKYATPLLMCLICIELSDFVFAVDSIPAVIGVSKDPFIVYSSNLFAIAALRSLYTLVAKAVTDLPYLKPAVALVLAFVGFKMIAEYFHYEVGIGISLGVVATLLAGGTIASIVSNKKGDQKAPSSS